MMEDQLKDRKYQRLLFDRFYSRNSEYAKVE